MTRQVWPIQPEEMEVAWWRGFAPRPERGKAPSHKHNPLTTLLLEEEYDFSS